MLVITGAAGFIGSALVAGLNQNRRDDIVIVDRLGSDEKWKNLINLRYTDYYNADDFLQMARGRAIDFTIEAILHLGACSSTTETDAAYLAQNNFQYSKAMAALAFEHGARFVYASSAATYGDGANGFSDDHKLLDSLKPLNMYGYSKQMFDLWAKRNGLLDKIAGLKYFNVFGPNEYHKGHMRSFVVKAFEQINQTGKVKLFKSENPDFDHGRQVRDFLYVKDAVDMTLWFLQNASANGIFNIGSGTPRTWIDLAGAVFAAMDKQPDIEFIDMPENLRDKYQYYTCAQMDKIKSAGYNKNPAPLEQSVSDYVQNYLLSGSYLSRT